MLNSLVATVTPDCCQQKVPSCLVVMVTYCHCPPEMVSVSRSLCPLCVGVRHVSGPWISNHIPLHIVDSEDLSIL